MLQFEGVFPATALGELRRLRRSDSLQRPLGVEIEIYNYEGNRPTDGKFGIIPVRWMTDGTIRTPSGSRAPKGIEMIIGPMFGRYTKPALESTGQWLASRYAEVNSTCGLHVHVAAQDLSPQQLRQVVYVYSKLESVFFSLVQEDRTSSQYGGLIKPGEWKPILRALRSTGVEEGNLPLQRAIYGIDSSLTGKQLGGMLSRMKREKRVPLRYRGFNIPGVFHQGTLEFRMHEGCVQIDRIRQWALLCGWFVEVASRLTPEETNSIKTPHDFLFGQWKRPAGGLLSLPKEVTRFIADGRDANPYHPAAILPKREGKVPAPPTSELSWADLAPSSFVQSTPQASNRVYYTNSAGAATPPIIDYADYRRMQSVLNENTQVYTSDRLRGTPQPYEPPTLDDVINPVILEPFEVNEDEEA